jgi:integrase
MLKKLIDGRHLFFLEVTTDGKKELVELGSNYPLALTRYHQIVDNVEQDKSTFAAVCDRYFREIIPKKAERTQRDNEVEICNLLEFFGTTNISDIKPSSVGQYLETRQAETRANREIALLSHIYNWARSWGYTANENPCRGVKRNKETKRGVYVSDELLARLYQSANQPLRNALRLAYFTGQRPADVLKMKWVDIYEKDGGRYLFVKQNKTGKKLSLIIDGDFAFFIDELPKSSDTLLGLSQGQLKYHFGNARTFAGIKSQQFQFRDLRAKRGTDVFNKHGLLQAQELLGHASERMTRVYVNNEMGDVIRTNL